MDIQGYIVEKLSGQSLPAFMRDHIFTPLGMTDAGFFVPADKRAPARPVFVAELPVRLCKRRKIRVTPFRFSLS